MELSFVYASSLSLSPFYALEFYYQLSSQQGQTEIYSSPLPTQDLKLRYQTAVQVLWNFPSR